VKKIVLGNRRSTIREIADDISFGSCQVILMGVLGMRRVSHSESPRPKKARQVRSNVKVLLTVFFDYRGVVHHEFLPQGRMVNKEYYLQVMRSNPPETHGIMEEQKLAFAP
jgi:hypothetical protein